ncbi:hypothetical protein EI94DRAFT_1851137 [Lactarius quietus]|nr:hypothetical protein EI94DRAFT_1851137 [Lactarius quietus]
MAQQEINHLKSHSSNKDQAQQEYKNHIQEQQEAWGNLEAFKNYKPNTNIVYHNEFGHALDQKEARKALSHKFHSKCSRGDMPDKPVCYVRAALRISVIVHTALRPMAYELGQIRTVTRDVTSFQGQFCMLGCLGNIKKCDVIGKNCLEEQRAQHMTVASTGLTEFSVMWHRSLEEKVIGKVVLNKWGLRTIGASSWGALATAGPIEVNADEVNCATGELFTAKGASG